MHSNVERMRLRPMRLAASAGATLGSGSDTLGFSHLRAVLIEESPCIFWPISFPYEINLFPDSRAVNTGFCRVLKPRAGPRFLAIFRASFPVPRIGSHVPHCIGVTAFLR